MKHIYYVNDDGNLVYKYQNDTVIKYRVSATFDKCLVCYWVGLSDDVENNKCPQCGSEDMDDAFINENE